MINKLAECVDEEDEYRKLAKSALKMQDYEAERCIEINKGFFNATYDILHKWRNSQPDGQTAFKNLAKALDETDMQDLVYVLEADETEIGGNFKIQSCDRFPNKTIKLCIWFPQYIFFFILCPQEEKFSREELDRAYEIACREGTMEVFNARMTLAGYHGAGKTSTATRLMGEKLNVEKSQSTEGIAMHKIKLNGGKWEKTISSTAGLLKDFSYGVLTKTDNTGNSEKNSQNPVVAGVSEPKKRKRDYSKTEAPKITESAERFKTSITIESSSKIQSTKEEVDLRESTKIQPMPEKTRRLLMKHTYKKKSEADTPETLTLWDLGGQNEFMTMHHLFLNAESTTVIVMDVTKTLNHPIGRSRKPDDLSTVEEVLHYWLNSIHADATRDRGDKLEPNIALVLTHKNKMREKKKWIPRYIDSIVNSIKGSDYADYITKKNIFVVDNTEYDDSDFERLRVQLLEYFTKQKSWGKKMPLRWQKLKADILEKAKEKKKKYLSIDDVRELAGQYGMNYKDVRSFLHQQNILGDFIYCSDDELNNTVLTDPQWLVDACTALITAEEFLKKRKIPPDTGNNLTNGRVTDEDLKHLWKDEVDFLKKLMKKFDLLIDISEGIDSRYIIPCMLPMLPEAGNDDDEFNEVFAEMELVYDALYKQPKERRFVIGTFHRLLSKCSKEEDWKLCTDPESLENHLSYTSAIFDIREGMKMALTLSHRGIRVRMWCLDEVSKRGLSTIYEELRLDRKVKKLCDVTLKVTKRFTGKENITAVKAYLTNIIRIYVKQECIPVGCVPPAC